MTVKMLISIFKMIIAKVLPENTAKAALSSIAKGVDEPLIDVLIIGVKSSIISAELAAEMLAAQAEIIDNAAQRPFSITAKGGIVIGAGASNITINWGTAPSITASDNAIIVTDNADGTININELVGTNPVTDTVKGKVTATNNKNPKISPEESNKILENADHAVVVWFENKVKTGRAAYKLDDNAPVFFEFNGLREISDTVIDIIKNIDGVVACNNPFVVSGSADGHVVLAPNVKGSKMADKLKRLTDLAACQTTDSNSKIKAPKGAAQPPKTRLSLQAAANKAKMLAAKAAEEQQSVTLDTKNETEM